MPDSRPSFIDQITGPFLDEMRLIGDPPADEVIAKLVSENGIEEARKIFDRLIREVELPVDELPEPVIHFISRQSRMPDWADVRKIRSAQDLFIDHGPKFLVFLYFKSLPTMYACKNGAQVLARTGRLAHDPEDLRTFSRRIAETGQFLMEVMAPGHLRENGRAIPIILKIRLIHAAIRAFLSESNWDESSLGKPINQEDMAMTVLSFSHLILEGLEQFGIRETPDKKDAYIHTWSVIGHFLGVRRTLMPESFPEAEFLKIQILRRQVAPSEQGQLLTKALIEFSGNMAPLKEFRNTPVVLIRYLVGNEMANDLAVSAEGGCLYVIIPSIFKKVLGGVERLEDHSLPLQLLINRISQKLMDNMVNYFNEYKEVRFAMPEALSGRWMRQEGNIS